MKKLLMNCVVMFVISIMLIVSGCGSNSTESNQSVPASNQNGNATVTISPTQEAQVSVSQNSTQPTVSESANKDGNTVPSSNTQTVKPTAPPKATVSPKPTEKPSNVNMGARIQNIFKFYNIFSPAHTLTYTSDVTNLYTEDNTFIYYIIRDSIRKFNKDTGNDALVTDSRIHDIGNIRILNNNLYFLNKVVLDWSNWKWQICKYDMKAKTTSVIKEFKERAVVNRFEINNEAIFYSLSNDDTFEANIYKIDLNSNTEKIIYTEKPNPDSLGYMAINYIKVIDNILYFALYKGQSGLGVYTFDLSTNQCKKLDNNKTTRNSSTEINKYGNKIFFVDNDNYLRVLSKIGGVSEKLCDDKVSEVVLIDGELCFKDLSDKNRFYGIKCDGTELTFYGKENPEEFVIRIISFKDGILLVQNKHLYFYRR